MIISLDQSKKLTSENGNGNLKGCGGGMDFTFFFQGAMFVFGLEKYSRFDFGVKNRCFPVLAILCFSVIFYYFCFFGDGPNFGTFIFGCHFLLWYRGISTC